MHLLAVAAAATKKAAQAVEDYLGIGGRGRQGREGWPTTQSNASRVSVNSTSVTSTKDWPVSNDGRHDQEDGATAAAAGYTRDKAS